MAKRANPFVDDFIPQSKVHVGIKQFNKNEEVYEKTLELLFKGAKKITVPTTLNNNNLNINKKEGKMKQLFIGKDGALLHSGCVVQESTTFKLCNCGSSVEALCGYCESVLCSTCQHDCERCKKTYCADCIIGADGPEMCISCYG